MSHFLREFEALRLEHQRGSATAVFECAGLDRSTLSRIRNRGFKLLFADLKQLAAALGNDEMIYLRLLRARLLDECTEPEARRIRVEIDGLRRQPPLAPRDTLAQLPPPLEKAMRNIAANLEKAEPGLRETVLFLGRLFNSEESDRELVVFENVLNDAVTAAKPPPIPAGGPAGPVQYRKARKRRA